MRRIAIGLNLLAGVFFLCFFAYTFVAQQHLEGLAREFVTEKTLQYSEPIIEVADASLNTALVGKFLSDEQSATIRHEIDEYRKDPPGYVADLTNQKTLTPALDSSNPLRSACRPLPGLWATRTRNGTVEFTRADRRAGLPGLGYEGNSI